MRLQDNHNNILNIVKQSNTDANERSEFVARPHSEEMEDQFPSLGIVPIRDWCLKIREKFRGPSMIRFIERRKTEISHHRTLSASELFHFEPVDPGKSRIPTIDYQNKVTGLFQFLADERRNAWNECKGYSNEDRKYFYEHALAELAGLRAEIVDLKSQISNSEKMMLAYIVGCVLIYSKDIVPSLFILVLPLLLAIFGLLRFREYQRNVFDLDCYLREVEQMIRPDSGWVEFFFKTRRMESFFESRSYIWFGAIAISTLVLVAGIAGLDDDNSWGLKPRPIVVEFKTHTPVAVVDPTDYFYI